MERSGGTRMPESDFNCRTTMAVKLTQINLTNLPTGTAVEV
jgi:hypothetical protein